MAKKKTAETANIKAAPVLRAGSGGEQPTPETPVITKSYSVRDDWKDKGVVNYVAFKSVDGEVQDLTVNGQPAGGGSGVPIYHIEWNVTAGPVNINMESKGMRKKLLYTLYDNGIYTLVDESGVKIANGTSTIDVACFISSGVYIMVENVNVTAVEGSATYDSDHMAFTITGDCKITLTAA